MASIAGRVSDFAGLIPLSMLSSAQPLEREIGDARKNVKAGRRDRVVVEFAKVRGPRGHGRSRLPVAVSGLSANMTIIPQM